MRLAGEAIPDPIGGITHLFPTPEALIALAEHDPRPSPCRATVDAPWSRWPKRCRSGTVTIDPGTDPAELRAALVRLPGIGPWTAEYVAMRALRDPDAFMPTDLGVRRAARALGQPDDPAHLTAVDRGMAPLAELRHGPPVGAAGTGTAKARDSDDQAITERT